jgi:hypothetical protein
MKGAIFRYILLNSLLLLILSACSGSDVTDGATEAVEAYNRALVANDINSATKATCLAWEEQALLEFDSFSATTTEVEGLSCQVSSTEGDYAVVTCQGMIIANYEGGDQEFSLAVNDYQAFFENSEWRMCGYR